MSFSISPNLPANVVEIGQELSQAKLDELNAGVLATQSWVSASYITSSSATSTFAPKASPTFTGTVTIPAGASISGYLTTSSASSTYQTISGMTSYLTTSAASTTYATRASPTFTGTVTIPAGASISGYLTIAQAGSVYLTIGTAANTYMPLSGMGAYATYSYVISQGYLTDAPSDGNEYVRKNAAWAMATGGGGSGAAAIPAYDNGITYTVGQQVIYADRFWYMSTAVGGAGYNPVSYPSYWTEISPAGGGGGGISDVPSGTELLYARRAGVLGSDWESITIPTVPPASVTNIDLTGNFNGYSMGSGYYSFKYDYSTNTLRMQDGVGSGVTVSATGITFPDSTTQTSASIPDAPNDGNYYVRQNGAWYQCQIATVYDAMLGMNVNVLRV